MKTITGLFNGCVVTSKGPYFYGETSEGKLIYADPEDVEKGFQLFRKYRLKIFDDGQEIPNQGFSKRAKILRMTFFFQYPDWLRLGNLKKLLFFSQPEISQAIAKLENVDPKRLCSASSLIYPSIQP